MDSRQRLLWAALTLGIPATAFANDGSDKEMAAYANSKYTYCDAKVLSAHWRQSIEEAKARIGRKIGWGDTRILTGMLDQARGEARKDHSRRCEFHEAGFTYNDAEKLAHLWHVSTDEAKTTVEDKILFGNEALVHQLLDRKH